MNIEYNCFVSLYCLYVYRLFRFAIGYHHFLIHSILMFNKANCAELLSVMVMTANKSWTLCFKEHVCMYDLSSNKKILTSRHKHI